MIVRLIKKTLARKEIRFLLVGGMNTAIGYTGQVLLSLVIPYTAAYTIMYVFGIINSFFWNKYFTFKSKGHFGREAVRFVLVYLVAYSVGLGILHLQIEILGIKTYIAFAINLLFTTLISWFGHRYFSFREKSSYGGSDH